MNSARLEFVSPDNPVLPGDVFSLEKMDAETTFLLAYSLSRCAFAKWEDGRFIDSYGNEIEGVYEFRLFNADFELRWVKIAKDTEGRGRYVKIAESQNGGTGCCSLTGKYLLWGRWNAQKNALCERRIWLLKIPGMKNIPNDTELALEYVEYFRVGEYGSLEFTAERLTGLKAV